MRICTLYHMPYPGVARIARQRHRNHALQHRPDGPATESAVVQQPVEPGNNQYPHPHHHSHRVELQPAKLVLRNDQVIDDLKDIAARAEHQEFNIPVIVAKLVVLLGMFLLEWASLVSKKKMPMAVLKVVAAVVFSVLYPWFSLALILAMATVYMLSNT